jgi:DNA modification methylase
LFPGATALKGQFGVGLQEIFAKLIFACHADIMINVEANPLSIERWPVARLIPYARNARTHSEAQIAQIAASIAEFGFNNPVLADPDGGIIAGHGRILAARKLGLIDVPVIVLRHLTANQKRAFMLADNQLALTAGWDLEMLSLELESLKKQDFDLKLTGFDERELNDLLARADKSLTGVDQVPAPQKQAVSVPGDIWLLGEHRLLCGDATRKEDLLRVLDGPSCDLVFADLPYNVDYSGKNRNKMKLVNDNLGADFGAFLLAACEAMLAVSEGPVYICMSSSELHHLHAAFVQAGGHWSTYIIWGKNTFTLGRSDYQRQYEPILYGWPERKKHFWCGSRNQGDLWLINKPHKNDLHPTMKPVELVERAINNSSDRGAVVLDPFAGSGTTVIACEKLARRARLIELDPIYTDVIVRRWEAYTGRSAVLHEDGRRFEEVSSDRLTLERCA